MLPIDKTGELIQAAPGFQLVISYNPGYQHMLKDLKPSTRQRFVALEFDLPPPERESGDRRARGRRRPRHGRRLWWRSPARCAQLRDRGLRGGAEHPVARRGRAADRERGDAARGLPRRRSPRR